MITINENFTEDMYGKGSYTQLIPKNFLKKLNDFGKYCEFIANDLNCSKYLMNGFIPKFSAVDYPPECEPYMDKFYENISGWVFDAMDSSREYCMYDETYNDVEGADIEYTNTERYYIDTDDKFIQHILYESSVGYVTIEDVLNALQNTCLYNDFRYDDLTVMKSDESFNQWLEEKVDEYMEDEDNEDRDIADIIDDIFYDSEYYCIIDNLYKVISLSRNIDTIEDIYEDTIKNLSDLRPYFDDWYDDYFVDGEYCE